MYPRLSVIILNCPPTTPNNLEQTLNYLENILTFSTRQGIIFVV